LIKGDISEIVFYQVYLGHKRRQTWLVFPPPHTSFVASSNLEMIGSQSVKNFYPWARHF
jgi:hypothetical protein